MQIAALEAENRRLADSGAASASAAAELAALVDDLTAELMESRGILTTLSSEFAAYRGTRCQP